MDEYVYAAPRNGMGQSLIVPGLLDLLVTGHVGSIYSSNQSGVREAFMKVKKNQTPRQKLYTAAQLANLLVPKGSDWTLTHVAGAFEEMTILSLHLGSAPTQYCASVVREIRQMNMHVSSANAIVAKLEGTRFSSEWILPKFDPAIAGFRIKKLRRRPQYR